MSEIAAIAAPPGLKGTVTVVEPDRHERAIARRSAETRATVPSLEITSQVDMELAVASAANLGCSETALLIHAVARALRNAPRLNAAYRDGRYELYSRVNLGVTLIAPGIHVTPTIFDADEKSAVQIAAELTDHREHAREGELHPAQLTGATFTVVDSSAYGTLTVSPLIVAPQSGALACGPIREVPVLREGRLISAHTMALVLSVDHRIVHGHHAASFLEEVSGRLQEHDQ
ncbi:MAG: 2-oxo acid dehydrogenase subunit E2 [Solirubrobacteraceae bacterium]